MTDFLELAERCERSYEPSREVECLVAAAINWRWPEWQEGEPTAREMVARHGVEWLAERMDDYSSIWSRSLPRFTENLGAARLAVPEGWQCVNLSWWEGEGASCQLMGATLEGDRWIHKFDNGRVSGDAITAEYALLAAALRAHAEMNK